MGVRGSLMVCPPLPTQLLPSHRDRDHHLKTYKSVLPGSKLVDWLLAQVRDFLWSGALWALKHFLLLLNCGKLYMKVALNHWSGHSSSSLVHIQSVWLSLPCRTGTRLTKSSPPGQPGSPGHLLFP